MSLLPTFFNLVLREIFWISCRIGVVPRLLHLNLNYKLSLGSEKRLKPRQRGRILIGVDHFLESIGPIAPNVKYELVKVELFCDECKKLMKCARGEGVRSTFENRKRHVPRDFD